MWYSANSEARQWNSLDVLDASAFLSELVLLYCDLLLSGDGEVLAFLRPGDDDFYESRLVPTIVVLRRVLRVG